MSGCTGLLGVGELFDGSLLAFVSHVDPIADKESRFGGDQRHVTSGDSPSNAALIRFLHCAQKAGAHDIKVVAAYHKSTLHHPDYGTLREREQDDWHMLDQIQNTLRRTRADISYVEIPYESGDGATLVVEHNNSADSIRFNGEEVKF